MVVPSYVTGIQVVANVLFVIAVVVVLEGARKRAAGRAGVPAAVGVALSAWLATTAVLAAGGAYRATSDAAIPGLPIALVIALGGAWLAVRTIPSLRSLVDQPATHPSLVALEAWRVIGVVFLILLSQGQLPPLFALPAGLGDIATGLAAPFVAGRLGRPGGRSAAIIWNVFGLLDLVVAIGLGTTTNLGPTQIFHTTPTSAIITAFPMALTPTFLVPLSVVLHVLSLRHLLGTRTASAGMAVAPGAQA